jgi:hypothetical protein
MARVVYNGPNVQMIVRGIVRSFLPEAGRRIRNRAVGKLGHYQPGWAPLAASTLQRKARRKRKIPGSVKYMSLARADDPLIDTGQMAQEVKTFVRGDSAYVTAPFPAEVHEQDPLMDARGFDVGLATGHVPKRAFLGPSLDEEIGPLTADLEAYVAGIF